MKTSIEPCQQQRSYNMYEEISVSSNQAQEGKYVRKPFTMNAVLERPEAVNTTPDRTAAETNTRNKEMGENPQLSSFNDDITSNEPNTNQPLEIRKPRPGEFSYCTGIGKLLPSIKVQELAHPGFSVGCRYHPLEGPVLNAVPDWIILVLYHVRHSQAGELFVCPQVLTKDPFNPDAWHEAEQALFLEPIQRWVAIDYDDSEGTSEYTLQTEYRNAEILIKDQDFGQQLEATLAPYVIKDVDHPTIRRLRQLIGDLADHDGPLIWQEVG
jgi:hypothetical protein